MAGQLWSASDQGQLLYSPLLSKEVTMQLQPKVRFAQFCNGIQHRIKFCENFVICRHSSTFGADAVI